MRLLARGTSEVRRATLVAVTSALVTAAGCLLTIPIDSLGEQSDAAATDAGTDVGDGDSAYLEAEAGDGTAPEIGGPCTTPCPMGICHAGACVIADRLRKPRDGLALDGANVYWTTLCGELGKHSLTGGATETLYGRDGLVFGGLAVTPAGAIWAERRNREVLLLTLTGTPPSFISIAPDSGIGTPLQVASGKSGNVYWLGSNEVWSVGFDAGVPLPAIQRARWDGVAQSLAVLEPYVAWGLSSHDGLDAGAVRALSVDGGADAPLEVADVATPVRGVAIDSAAVYFASDDGTISTLATLGGPIRVIARGQDQPTGLAVDEAFVYWTNRGSGSNGTLRRANKLGVAESNPITTYASGLAWPSAVLVTSSFVYWVNEGASDETACSSTVAAKGSVERIAK